MNLIDQLVRIYLDEENWHAHKLSRPDAYRYFEVAFDNDCLILCTDYDKLVGYVEFWRLSFEQFGRVLCHLPFDISQEDVTTGPIVYLANTFVLKEARGGWVIKYLRDEFFRRNIDADFFVGEALRKKTQPVKVFRRQEAFKKWAYPALKEIKNGQ